MNLEIVCRTQPGRPAVSNFRVNIDPGMGLSKRERTILYNTARTCHVHKILGGQMAFEYHLKEIAPDAKAVGMG